MCVATAGAENFPLPKGRPSAISAFAWLSQPDGDRLLRVVGVIDLPLPVDFGQFGITARPPGRYVTACAAGYADPCGPGESEAIDLEFAGIQCCLLESVTGIFWWNGETGLFDGTPVSD